MNNANITFVGAGNIARALISGLLAAGYDPQKIWATNPSLDKLDFFRQNFGIHTTQNNQEGVSYADIVILSVKTTVLAEVCKEIKELIAKKCSLVISIAVGPTDHLLQKWLGPHCTIVRAIPNVPALVGAGVTGLYAGENVRSVDRDLAEAIFRAVGVTLWVKEENQLDLICGISSSGPAYIFLIMESMEEAATKMGLSQKTARLLIAQTLLGSSRLALESEQSLVQLRKHVTSPKGTTEQALKVLEEGKIRQLLAEAIQAAVDRAKEITQLLTGELE